MTENVFIGIPILNRLDLLRNSIASIDIPAEVVVINNNSIDPEFKCELSTMSKVHGFEVLHQHRNLGVSTSWNLIIRTGLERGHDWMFIGSNDTVLHAGSLRAAKDLRKDDQVAVYHLHAWNFFLLSRQTIEKIGWFDENFYPAYKEDQDYDYRCGLAGKRRTDVPGAGADHIGSATIKSNADYSRQNARTHADWNHNHYLMKWGGDRYQEKYTTPYDDPRRDLKWWPDPGGSIEERDWDNIYRRRIGTLYQRAVAAPSDISEHLPKLYEYACRVSHITEFGTRTGISTTAFLYANPDTLVAYDLDRQPELDDLERAAKAEEQTFSFVQADTRELAGIDPTDLLFIDTWHTGEQLRAELQFADVVRKYIILHDTETFGRRGEDGGEGLQPAIDEFLRDHPEWVIAEVHTNNNGLTILQRLDTS